MDAKERARRFREHQVLVSKVVKQQEDIKKKRRQKLTGEVRACTYGHVLVYNYARKGMWHSEWVYYYV